MKKAKQKTVGQGKKKTKSIKLCDCKWKKERGKTEKNFEKLGNSKCFLIKKNIYDDTGLSTDTIFT